MMARSPLPSAGLPGLTLLGFIACGVVFRRQPYQDAGGYETKFFVGGEEELLALDLVAQGWNGVYAPQLVVHHYPSAQRNTGDRHRIVIHNALWVTWLRLPLVAAFRQSCRICRDAYRRKVLKAAFFAALSELPWVIRERKVIPADVAFLYRALRG